MTSTDRETHPSLAAWNAHFEQTFGEVVEVLKSRGATWRVENGQVGLQVTVNHLRDRRFGFAFGPTVLSGLRGRRYDASDAGKPSERADFIGELKRRLATVGASYEDVFFQRPGFLERPKRGRPRGPLTIARDAY